MINAHEVKEIAENGLKKFEKNVIEGPVLKKVIDAIEYAAIEGYKGWQYKLDIDDIRVYRIIEKYLTEAGFECEITETTHNNLVVSYVVQTITVRW